MEVHGNRVRCRWLLELGSEQDLEFSPRLTSHRRDPPHFVTGQIDVQPSQRAFIYCVLLIFFLNQIELVLVVKKKCLPIILPPC